MSRYCVNTLGVVTSVTTIMRSYALLVKNPYIRAQTSGQLTASDSIRTTHENIAIYCGELPAANCLFFVKKKKGQ